MIEDVIVVNEGECYQASVLIEDGRIKKVEKTKGLKVESSHFFIFSPFQCFLFPGIIDGHVHMREPGLTHKATMESETRAAARGGVTTVLDMPNVVPQTTTLQLLKERYAIAEGQCHVNYGFYLGATNDNLEEIKRLDPTLCPGVKLFMGSSTGGMLVDREEKLRQIFRHSPTLVMTHCEDTERIKENLDRIQNPKFKIKNDSPLLEKGGVSLHPLIRDHEACYRSTELAVRLAKEEGARLHVAHITTAQELELFQPNDERITAEACVPHLLFTDADYETLGARIKCNPAIKTAADRDALRRALTDGRIRTIATDHAPHLLSEKEGGVLRAMSGMPMVQFSLPAVLSLVDDGILSIERAVELMCHNPARLYHIKERGFIREGYYADLVLVRRKPCTVTKDCIESRCGWSPLEGRTLGWQVEKTWVNGNLVWDGASFPLPPGGKRVFFDNE
ncbi:MAG: dihydroorotase [Bacteroidaceae bacterium]|nr:dihydroorotase [Bacteroidaceae bacterium]